jgi:hypothetical protein
MSPEMLPLLLKSFWETCYMVLASTSPGHGNRDSPGRHPYRDTS